MRLGILTFHSQLNYGGVLQAFALQAVLMRAGYDVQIVDRWLTVTNETLRGKLLTAPWRMRMMILLRVMVGLGDVSRQWRHFRTMFFLSRKLVLSKEHFTFWNDLAVRTLKLDVLIVGSDQVWNGTWPWSPPDTYLLSGAPDRFSAIAYAASFGMRQIPKELEPLYCEGFRRFSAISVREAEGIQLVESMGAQATHVVDPTILLDPMVWREQVAVWTKLRPLLVCYLLSEDIEKAVPKLEAFVKHYHVEVRVFVDHYLRPFPKSVGQVLRQLRWMWGRVCSPVKLCLSAGPQEFLDAFAQADWILSDSFHALMFSAIFDKQVAILRPKNDDRKAMFARIEEFVEAATEGPVIEDSVEAALARFERGETMAFRHDVIQARREASWAWLKAALEKVERERAGMRSS